MNLLIEWLIWRWVVLPRFHNWQLAGPVLFDSRICTLNQGSSTPRPQTTTSPWPSRNLATQQEVSGRPAHLYPYLEVLPIACVTNWAPPTVRSVAALDSYRSWNLPVNCASEGSIIVFSFWKSNAWSSGGTQAVMLALAPVGSGCKYRLTLTQEMSALGSSWNHTLPPVMEKLSFIKPVPGARKVGDCCFKPLGLEIRTDISS